MYLHLTFCGTLSELSLFSESHQALLMVNLFYKLYISCRFGTSVLTSSFVVNRIMIADIKLNNEPLWKEIHIFRLLDKAVQTHHLAVNKYEFLILNLTVSSNIEFFYFDGPGFLSKKYISNSNTVVKLTHFQCLVQSVVSNLNLNISTDFGQIDFSSLPMQQKIINIVNQKKTTVSCASHKCVTNNLLAKPASFVLT